MAHAIGIVLLLALAGCAGPAQHQSTASPCAAGEATYACQVERYQNVNVN